MRDIVIKLSERIRRECCSLVLPGENYRELSPSGDDDLTFIDGGNAEVFASPSVSVHLIRLHAVTAGSEKKHFHKEFFCIATMEGRKARVEALDQEFPSLDIEVDKDSTCGSACDAFRRLSELRFALGFKTPVVLDGSFETRTDEDKALVQDLLTKRSCAISKTCSLLSDEGYSLAAASMRCSPFPLFSYQLPAKGFCSYLVKLHKSSKHAFRLDCSDTFRDAPSSLVRFCSDPIFPGYPYPLIEADKLARISKKEAGSIRLRLTLALDKDGELLQNSSTAHDILDNVQ